MVSKSLGALMQPTDPEAGNLGATLFISVAGGLGKRNMSNISKRYGCSRRPMKDWWNEGWGRGNTLKGSTQILPVVMTRSHPEWSVMSGDHPKVVYVCEGEQGLLMNGQLLVKVQDIMSLGPASLL